MQEEYWGSMDRYNRLLRVKQQWDPDHLFWCHHCVGSDLVTHQSEARCANPFGLYSTNTSSSGRAIGPPVLSVVILILMLKFLW